jgi:hypothetical protein
MWRGEEGSGTSLSYGARQIFKQPTTPFYDNIHEKVTKGKKKNEKNKERPRSMKNKNSMSWGKTKTKRVLKLEKRTRSLTCQAIHRADKKSLKQSRRIE